MIAANPQLIMVSKNPRRDQNGEQLDEGQQQNERRRVQPVEGARPGHCCRGWRELSHAVDSNPFCLVCAESDVPTGPPPIPRALERQMAPRQRLLKLLFHFRRDLV